MLFRVKRLNKLQNNSADFGFIFQDLLKTETETSTIIISEFRKFTPLNCSFVKPTKCTYGHIFTFFRYFYMI